MAPESYSELRCAVVETFYEVLLSEGYTIGQAAGRCLVEFRSETQGGGRTGLIALSVLLSRAWRGTSRRPWRASSRKSAPSRRWPSNPPVGAD